MEKAKGKIAMFSLFIFIVLTFTTVSTAEEAESIVETAGIEFSGFFDVQYQPKINDNQTGKFAWGQFELDLAKCLAKHLSVEGAISYDNANETFYVGAGIIDFKVCGCEDEHYIQSRKLDKSGVIIGQFDVPFGLFWQDITPFIRKSVSMPLIVETSQSYWNDLGVMAYAEKGRWNAVVFALNGIAYDVTNPVTILNPDYCIGGRIGFTAFKGLEMGGSYAGSNVADLGWDMNLMGADLTFSVADIEVKGEYIRRGYYQSEAPALEGEYLQMKYDFKRLYLLYRFDGMKWENARVGQRNCLGWGYKLDDNAEIRSEYQIIPDQDPVWFLQVAVEF
jgi:hypothetical protein